MLKNRIAQVVDWSKVDKEDYLLAMERSPIKDVEIKVLLKAALTDDVNSREVFMKGIDHSYYYEGYTTAEAASMLGIPEKTVSTRLFRARAKLRTILEEE